MILGGCNSGHIPLPEESALKADAAKTKAPEMHTINSAGGHLDFKSDDDKRTLLYSITWESAKLEFTSEQEFGGEMTEVKGVFYQEGKPASSFVAHRAVADRGKSTLKLADGVEIKAMQKVGPVPRGSSLFCGGALYDAKKGTIDAFGGITVHDDTYLCRGIEAVRANTDLTLIATPDMFNNPPPKTVNPKDLKGKQ